MNQSRDKFWTGPEAFSPQKMPLQHLALPTGPAVHLWYLHLGVLGGSLQHAMAGNDRADTGPNEVVGLNSAHLRFVRRFYLRLLLGAYLQLPGKDVVISYSKRGKPELDVAIHGEKLKFSMAKSENRVLIGISTSAQLGVDLEPAGRKAHDALRLAQRYFSATEYLALKALGPQRMDQAFLRAWALNEAVVKASGLGIANQLCRFTLEMNPDLPPALLAIDDDDASNWSVALVKPCDEFIAAVASRQPRLDIACFQLLPSA